MLHVWHYIISAKYLMNGLLKSAYEIVVVAGQNSLRCGAVPTTMITTA